MPETEEEKVARETAEAEAAKAAGIKKPEEETITLTKKEVQEMLSNQAKLEAKLASLTSEEEEESPAVGKEEKEEVDFNKMTPKQFYDHIKDTLGGPLMMSITALGIKMEMADVMKEFEDFPQYKEEIRKYMMKNPFSPVKDAYLLVKAKIGKKEEAKKEEPKPAGPIPHGEKPNVTSAAIKQGQVKTVREAAELAAKEVLK